MYVYNTKLYVEVPSECMIKEITRKNLENDFWNIFHYIFQNSAAAT